MTTDPEQLPQPPSAATWRRAQQAFALWKQALETGDGRPFAALLHEEVTFRVRLPHAEWRSEQRGRWS